MSFIDRIKSELEVQTAARELCYDALKKMPQGRLITKCRFYPSREAAPTPRKNSTIFEKNAKMVESGSHQWDISVANVQFAEAKTCTAGQSPAVRRILRDCAGHLLRFC